MFVAFSTTNKLSMLSVSSILIIFIKTFIAGLIYKLYSFILTLLVDIL